MDIERELDNLVRSKKMGNCKKCGGNLISNRMGRYTCDKCGSVELDEEGKVREYLEKNGPSPYRKVGSVTGAGRDILEKFIIK